MELFSEIYNCYFQIVDEICKTATENPITEKEMMDLATRFGFEESGFMIVPKLKSDWNLLTKTKDGYLSKIDNPDVLPLTTLQKRWLKAILSDARIGLFLEKAQMDILNAYLINVEPLFLPEDFYYYDRFQDGDDFTSPEYVSHFRTLLGAIRNRQYVDIRFYSRKGKDVCHTYLPCRLEYSAKNDKFRLLALSGKNNTLSRVETINISRIDKVTLTDKTYNEEIDLAEKIKTSYYKDPVHLLITTGRNTLERTMLHFANYQKQTKRLDEDTYECMIYYNSMMETELLIEILSFGPTIKVLGPEDFLRKVKERIHRQIQLTAGKAENYKDSPKE